MDYEDFSQAQQQVIDTLLGTDDSVLVTGVAGCGKSTVLRHWRSRATDRALVLAPTGVAALNVGGSTIHRAFGFRPNMDVSDPRITLKVKSLLHTIDTIVIDEVSMLRADLLHAMDVVLRSVKRSEAPFGGVRMVMVGDFWQLPPVVRSEEERDMEENHGSRYGWVFFAPAFQKLEPKIFFLRQSFRQQGGAFTDVLNRVRHGDPAVAKAINAMAGNAAAAGDKAPRLCARKNDVARYNADGLRALGSPVITIPPDITGDRNKIPRDAQEPVVLAEGARVMITRNGNGYVNGSVGTLVDFDAEAELWDGTIVPAIEVKLDSGVRVVVPREEQEVIGYTVDPKTKKPVKEVLASVRQYPLNLGYAWTIHKSQGQTLDAALIDLGRGAFAHGQTYVALSRLRTGAGLYLAGPLQHTDLLIDPDVPAFFDQFGV